MGSVNSSEAKRFWLCPLCFFKCAHEDVNLALDIQIKSMPEQFTTYLLKHHPNWTDVLGADFMVVLPHSNSTVPSKGKVIDFPNIITFHDETTYTQVALSDIYAKNTILIELITALRLCHSGDVMPGPLVFAELQNSIFSIPSWMDNTLGCELLSSLTKTDTGTLESLEYEFRQSDVPKVNELLEKLHAYRASGELSDLEEVLGRFNSAYHGELEDRLIDQMIALETLYIGDDKELGYKLALRTAFLLAEDEDGRKDIFSDLKKAYDLRGKVVHGSKKVEGSEVVNAVLQTEEYLRQSIRKFLKLLASGYSLGTLKKGKGKKPAILDENILKNGALLA